MKYVDQIRISKNLFLIIALTGVLITPLLSFEPILWIKELTLVSITFSTVSIYLLNKENFRKADKLTKYLSIAMLIALLLNLKFSEIDIGTWLWGYFGRANGTLTYTSFLLILFLNSIIDDEAHIKRILRAILIACSFNALYMAFQLADLDPITWNTKETFGFLGNINFSSALTGIFCVILFWQATNTRNVFSFITQCALIMILLYVIWLSGSIQGILMFAIGVQFRCLRILLDTSWFNGRIRLKKITALSQLIVPYFVILTISMPSFFGGRFVQETMLFRKDYWLAAYNMFLNRPFFGVGIDNYGNFYREYRSLSASSDFDRVSNSAHSIFLDLLSGGGATLFLPYFILVIYISLRAIKLFSTNNVLVDGLLVSIWFSLQIQNFIGIQTIILGVINWSVAGMILARSSSLVFSNNNQGNTEKGPTNAKIDSNQKKVVNSKKIIKSRSISAELLAPSTYAISGIFFLLGVIVASPPFFNDIAFNNKFERNDIEGMKRIGSNNIGNQVLLSVSLERATINDNGEESLQIARILTQKYPRSYYGWDVLNKLKVTPDDLRERANNEIRLIEPRYETSG